MKFKKPRLVLLCWADWNRTLPVDPFVFRLQSSKKICRNWGRKSNIFWKCRVFAKSVRVLRRRNRSNKHIVRATTLSNQDWSIRHIYSNKTRLEKFGRFKTDNSQSFPLTCWFGLMIRANHHEELVPLMKGMRESIVELSENDWTSLEHRHRWHSSSKSCQQKCHKAKQSVKR